MRPHALHHTRVVESIDDRIRASAFAWLREQVDLHGDVLPSVPLQKGFPFGEDRIPLWSMQGIFKPRQLDVPLSIRTSPDGPYDDDFDDEGFLLYRYRGTDPQHPDNRGLRRAMFERKPLVYLFGLVPGRYLVVWPVFVVGDEPDRLTFTIAVDYDYYADPARHLTGDGADLLDEDAKPRRRYITRTVRTRLHQRGFRERVLQAYRCRCALCRLRHAELLDAAHIIPDREESGIPEVRNGISMCKLHHAAFDRFVLGVSPDYEVHVRDDILDEIDGPMLQHGLKEMHGARITVPRTATSRPDRDLLAERFEQFRRFG